MGISGPDGGEEIIEGIAQYGESKQTSAELDYEARIAQYEKEHPYAEVNRVNLDYNFGTKRFIAANPEVEIIDSEQDYEEGARGFSEKESSDAAEPVYSGMYYDKVAFRGPHEYEPIISGNDPRYTDEMERKAYPQSQEK